LVTHPKVLDWRGFGIPDDEMRPGSVKGVVQTVDPRRAEEFADELRTGLRERWRTTKCPRSVSFEQQLRRTTRKI